MFKPQFTSTSRGRVAHALRAVSGGKLVGAQGQGCNHVRECFGTCSDAGTGYLQQASLVARILTHLQPMTPKLFQLLPTSAKYPDHMLLLCVAN